MTEIETKWALTLVTTLGRRSRGCTRASGRQVLRRSQAEDLRLGGAGSGDMVRPSDLPQTESGAAALVVRQRWLRIRGGWLPGRSARRARSNARAVASSHTIAGFRCSPLRSCTARSCADSTMISRPGACDWDKAAMSAFVSSLLLKVLELGDALLAWSKALHAVADELEGTAR
ncbi:MAG: hypothetical protein R2697_05290 [Ilumatobacteraceae bacterium]